MRYQQRGRASQKTTEILRFRPIQSGILSYRFSAIRGENLCASDNTNGIVHKPMNSSSFGFKSGLVLTTWLIAVVAGMTCFLSYKNAPGEVTRGLHFWPESSSIVRATGRPQLLLFAHPRCPCTRASLRELVQVMSDCRGLVSATIVVFQPHEGDGEHWNPLDLVDLAQDNPGVELVRDVGGVEQQRFGIKTSGHVLLFDERGTLQFSGGITASRGHSGDNLGRSTLTALLRGRPAAATETFVFGCPLCSTASAAP